MRNTSHDLRGSWQRTNAGETRWAAAKKPPMSLTQWVILGALGGLTLLAPSVRAADHRNLEDGIPTEIEDASPIAFRSLEQQSRFNYEDDGERGGIFLLEPELTWGLIKNGQVTVRAPFVIGGGNRSGSGDLKLEALYNFNVETRMVPAMALSVGVSFPSGENSEGVGTTVKGIMTKGVRRARFHLNGGVTNVGAAPSEERDIRYTIGLGTDHPLDFGLFPLAIGLDNLVIANVFVEQSALRGEQLLWTGELGVRHQFKPWTVFAIGAGAGLSRGAADYRLTVAYQYTFPAF